MTDAGSPGARWISTKLMMTTPSTTTTTLASRETKKDANFKVPYPCLVPGIPWISEPGRGSALLFDIHVGKRFVQADPGSDQVLDVVAIERQVLELEEVSQGNLGHQCLLRF